jgi:hypothetical protein
MICTELDDRLFDEDCRAALLGRGLMPSDLAAHIATCPTCAVAWSHAQDDIRGLSQRLVVAPPPALLKALDRAYRAQANRRVPWFDAETLSWVICGGAAGAILAGTLHVPPAASQWAGFCVGASFGLALAALQRTRSTWGASWNWAMNAVSRSVDRLVQAI